MPIIPPGENLYAPPESAKVGWVNERLEKAYQAVIPYRGRAWVTCRKWPTATRAEAYGVRLLARLARMTEDERRRTET